MKKGLLITIGVIVLIVVILGSTFVSKYNQLVKLDEDVNMSLSQIDNQLQRRNDLIPNLVETVKAYAAHEEEIFTAIAEARSALIGATGVQDKAEADAAMTSSLSRLLAIAENYPDLKANQNFLALQDELAGTENRIAFARQDYNTVAASFNRVARSFPMMMFAKMFGFDQAAYFEASPGASEVPTVKFGE
ncbi:MAG TPA: LemA family protein [Clostridiales bacterium UBA8960]|jgi:LemA protein|nr:LemA family protein [Clostridiales bacterium UBA8960]